MTNIINNYKIFCIFIIDNYAKQILGGYDNIKCINIDELNNSLYDVLMILLISCNILIPFF